MEVTGKLFPICLRAIAVSRQATYAIAFQQKMPNLA